MKKIYVLLCSILLSMLTFIANAQTEPEKKKHGNDVGFNTTFLLNGVFNSGQAPFSLMYKNYKDNNNPIRLGVQLYINLSDVIENASSNYTNSSDASFSAVVGKEFQKEINKNWIWYFGGDIVPSFRYYYIDYHSSSGYEQTENTKIVSLGFMPFLGVRFNINSRLYLSTEFSFGPKYSYTWTKGQEGYPSNIVNRDAEVGRFNFSMNPAYGLLLYYRF